jgi:NAD(P)-dependent dehydrogenase (short-subunit alcohol dehydrogenase family)
LATAHQVFPEDRKITMDLLPEFQQGVTLVIGGSGGLGAAICTTLASLGSNIALTYRSRADAAKDLADQIRAVGREAHVTQVDIEDASAVQAMVDEVITKFGHIHSVVYAAGPPLEFLYINEIKPDEWARVINADVNGCFNVVAATLPHLRTRRAGNYVAIVTAAVDRSPPRDILSAAPKAAIQMFIRGVAREEGRSGIRANCVGPGYIEAGLGLSTVHEHTADYVQRMVRAIPLRRPGKAQDIADVVAFLLSLKSSYITGVTIPVAGGLQLS